MNISDKLLRSFSDIINKRNDTPKKKQNATVLGTVVKEGENVSVKIDGSDISTPATALVGVDNGDRVDVLIENHKAIITANHTSPAITKFGDVYVTMSPDGVIVGKLDEDEQPTGASILIDPTTGEFRIVDVDGKALARFGVNSQIGRDDKPHTKTTGTDFLICDANGNVLATFGSTANVKRLVSDSVDVFSTGVNASTRVAAYDANGVLKATGRLLATSGTGRFGVYDGQASNWLIYSEPNGDVHNRTTPILLRSETVSPSRISPDEVYTNVSTPNLSKYSMVVAYCRCGLTYTTITFIRGGSTERFLSYYNGRLIRGGFKVDWDNNRFRVRCTIGNDGDQQYVSISHIYGILTR